MFAPGELIYCGRRGVCRVEGIDDIDGRPYYHLEPLYYTCTIRTPVDGKVFMRPVMTKAEAEALIDLIPSVEAPPVQSKAMRELTERYQTKINTHEAAELLSMLMSIHAKKQSAGNCKNISEHLQEISLHHAFALYINFCILAVLVKA